VGGEVQVWQVVVPNWVMKDKLVVPISPVVTNTIVHIYDQSWYVEHLEAGSRSKAALASA